MRSVCVKNGRGGWQCASVSVWACVCLSAVLGSVLFPSGALARAARFQTNSPEHVAGSAVPAGPPAALQSCRPQCKQVAEPASLRKHGHTEWAAGSSAERRGKKNLKKFPTDLHPRVELAKMKKKVLDGVCFFSLVFFFVQRAYCMTRARVVICSACCGKAKAVELLLQLL